MPAVDLKAVPTPEFASPRSLSDRTYQIGEPQQQPEARTQIESQPIPGTASIVHATPLQNMDKVVDLHREMLKFLQAIAQVAKTDEQLRKALRLVYGAVAQALEEA